MLETIAVLTPAPAVRGRGRPCGRPKPDLTLDPSDRAVLERWTLGSRATRALALRSRIVLRCAEGIPNRAIAEELRVTPHMVGRWRARFVARGLDGLLDLPRPDAPRGVSSAAVARLVRMTLEPAPCGAARWSTRSMAKASGLTQSTVSRVWRAFGLGRRRARASGVSRGAPVLEAAHDVVGVFVDSGIRAVALRSGSDPGGGPPEPPPAPESGTSSETGAFLATVERAFGLASVVPPGRRSTVELLRFLGRIDESVPPDATVLLVLDVRGVYRTAPVRGWLARHPRVRVRLTAARSACAGAHAPLFERALLGLSSPAARELEAAARRHVSCRPAGADPFAWTLFDRRSPELSGPGPIAESEQ